MPPASQSLEKRELGSAEANRRFYETQAAIYDETEFCARDEGPRRALRDLLERAVTAAGPGAEAILDAGGGTGNASLLLHEMGLEPVLVDASPEMISRYEAKARSRGIEPRTEVGDLEALFAADQRSWDVIVFSSVLHHLEDPAATLAGAAPRLRPGGVIATLFDPIAVDRTGMLLRKLDYACWIALHSPATLGRAVARRLRPQAGAAGAEPHIPALAERHAMSGLDDGAIIAAVEAAGVRALEHERFHDARYRWVIALSRALDSPTHFSLLLQRTPG